MALTSSALCEEQYPSRPRLGAIYSDETDAIFGQLSNMGVNRMGLLYANDWWLRGDGAANAQGSWVGCLPDTYQT